MIIKPVVAVSAFAKTLLDDVDAAAMRTTLGVSSASTTVTPVSAAYTTLLADANTVLSHPAADTTARAWVIDSNANVPYPIGTWITFDNEFGAGALTVSITADVLEKVPTGEQGSIVVASGGALTIVKKTATKWRASGVGVTP